MSAPNVVTVMDVVIGVPRDDAPPTQPYEIVTICRHGTHEWYHGRACPEGCHLDPARRAACKMYSPDLSNLVRAGLIRHSRKWGCDCSDWWMAANGPSHAARADEPIAMREGPVAPQVIWPGTMVMQRVIEGSVWWAPRRMTDEERALIRRRGGR